MNQMNAEMHQTPLQKMMAMARAESKAAKEVWKVDVEIDDFDLSNDQQFVGVAKSKTRDMQEIVEEVAAAAGVSVENIIGKYNEETANRARSISMWKAKDAGHSIKAIGAFFGGRHSSTVIRAIEKNTETMPAAV